MVKYWQSGRGLWNLLSSLNKTEKRENDQRKSPDLLKSSSTGMWADRWSSPDSAPMNHVRLLLRGNSISCPRWLILMWSVTHHAFHPNKPRRARSWRTRFTWAAGVLRLHPSTVWVMLISIQQQQLFWVTEVGDSTVKTWVTDVRRKWRSTVSLESRGQASANVSMFLRINTHKTMINISVTTTVKQNSDYF